MAAATAERAELWAVMQRLTLEAAAEAAESQSHQLRRNKRAVTVEAVS